MKAFFTFCFLTLMVTTSYATEIRVRNDSDVDFKDIVVGGKKYGDIKPGATTDYQSWKTAYRYSSVMLIADSKPMQLQLIDYLGELQLGVKKGIIMAKKILVKAFPEVATADIARLGEQNYYSELMRVSHFSLERLAKKFRVHK